jgi:RNA polymerase sigma-70 factor (ECF subfamily)
MYGINFRQSLNDVHGGGGEFAARSMTIRDLSEFGHERQGRTMADQGANSGTSPSLLWRLQLMPTDALAWTEFMNRYGPRIVAWCRQWRLQEADTQDVAQTVMLKLLRAMQTFQYDPDQKFRAWLKTVTHNAWQDLVRSHRRVGIGGMVETEDAFRTVAARDDLSARLEEEYETELLDQAMARVRRRLLPQTWDAFRLTALDGLSGAAAAARLGMAITSVYKAKSNVQKMLEGEVRTLEGQPP